MSAELLVAVDGGNSKTDLVLFRGDGSVVAAVRGAGSNPHSLGLAGALDLIGRLIDAAGRQASLGRGSRRPTISAGAFFLAGADQPDELRDLQDAIKARGWVDDALIGNDTLALLWAGSAAGFGVAVVVGAGVNGIGRAESGLEAHFGALGAITGDWGGGPGIGLAALGAAVRGEEGRSADTALSSIIADHFGKRTAVDVAVAVHRGTIAGQRLGELPSVVFDAAERGDREANAIVDGQADEVVGFAVAALRRTEQTREPIRVIIGGSVMAAAPVRLIDRIRDGVAKVAPQAQVVLWRGRPVVGAAVALLHLTGADDAARARLRAELTDDRMAQVDGAAPGGSGMKGAFMASEMAAQPAILDALVARREEIIRAVRAVVPRHLAGITLVARGSSDNAAVYGRYLLEMAAGRPAGLAAPSVHTVYGSAVDYSGYLAVGLSQSGRTPEIIGVLKAMRRQGARTVAIVNDGGDSPLGDAAEAVIDIRAGVENAVPATKTFTAMLLAVALLAEALGSQLWPDGSLQMLPAQVAASLEAPNGVDRVATDFDASDRVLVTARGLLLVAALETALKIRETSAILAEAMSSADLRHGPIAAVGAGHPVLAMTGARTRNDVEDVIRMLRDRGAVVRTVSDAPGADIPIPIGIPEPLLPIVASVRGQQIAATISAHRDLDADRPAGLSKVTPTH